MAAALAVGLWAGGGWAETIEFVTYYPAPGGGGPQDSQARSLRVGSDYQILPAPEDGVAVISDAIAIGVPVPASGTITPAGALQVVGIPGGPDKVLFEPGAGGTMELEVTGNVKLPPTAATGGTATAGALLAGTERFLHNYGTEHTYLGIQAGTFIPTGARGNTGLGARALSSNTGGPIEYATAVGAHALASNTAFSTHATAVGARALASNSSWARYATAIGSSTLASTDGRADFVTLVGASILISNTSRADYSTVVGSNCLITNTGKSDYNTVVGANALAYGRDGSYKNTVVGFQAGRNATGSGNVFLGYQAGMNEAGSNKLYIDNSSTNTPLIWGDFQKQIVRINGSFQLTPPPYLPDHWSTVRLKWRPSSYEVGKDLAELFNSPAGPLPAGTIAGLGANGDVVAAAAGSQTLGPTPALPGIIMDGPSQKIGPTPEDLNVPGKTAVALAGRVSVQTQGPVQAGDILVAGPAGKAVRWSPGESALSYVGLVLEVNPKAPIATVLVGHQGLRKVADSIQDENRALREELDRMEEDLQRLKRIG